MKLRPLFFLILTLCTLTSQADEGMWLLGSINKQVRSTMKEMGLEVPFDKVYSPKHHSLSNAVVNFGGFCSGVVVSDNGLVFTNHHCGFGSIQQLSTPDFDIIKNGYAAYTLEEELSDPELYVRFLVRSEDVTKRMLKNIKPDMSESERTNILDSIARKISEEVSRKDSTLVGVVDAYYAGNEFWLSVYRDYNDVRLVFAPPSNIGKFGWDADNWMWPRHTGDFCVFRIYADANNQPADYSPDNVPYRPDYVAPISLDGYQSGSFCMTMGYPGSTERYMSSYGILEMVEGINQAMIDIRGIKQDIWKREINANDSIRIQYASKYDESSNYWKNSIGKNKAIYQLNILEKKRAQEATLLRWIQDNPKEREKLLHLFTNLELAYSSRKETDRALAYYVESFLNGPELVQVALEILNFDFEGEEKDVMRNFQKLLDQYDNLNLDVDKEVFVAMLNSYPKYVSKAYLPAIYTTIDTLYQGNVQAYVDTLYATSKLTTTKGLELFLAQDSTYQIIEDPAVEMAIDIILNYYDMNQSMMEANENIEKGERLLNDAMRRMYASNNFYPDANFTMRLSFGTVQGYSPYDGAFYNYYTTPMGIVEKVKEHWGDPDFEVNPRLMELFNKGEYGKYGDEEGEMRVCFISNNDITGGNSGSAMFNGKGELIGLAFDGNWEAMSSDIAYEPNMQRCIGVDVRYMLFIIEQYGEATNIIEELKLK